MRNLSVLDVTIWVPIGKLRTQRLCEVADNGGLPNVLTMGFEAEFSEPSLLKTLVYLTSRSQKRPV